MSWFFRIAMVLTGLYGVICATVYWLQEKLLFHPTILAQDFVFPFVETPFEERYIEVVPGIQLHALHFKVDNPKGVVFYVHGNAGSLHDWGTLAGFYQREGYDLFMFDYRGFGKSQGKIVSENQFFADAEFLYQLVLKEYDESKIVIEGFSIGTATASKLAAEHQPRALVLKAPYYTLGTLVQSKFPFLPQFLLKYRFKTVEYLRQVQCPITIFHGTADELIPYDNATRLAKAIPAAELITAPNCLHNDIPYTKEYQERMKAILNP